MKFSSLIYSFGLFIFLWLPKHSQAQQNTAIYYADQRAAWLQKAKLNTPKLQKRLVKPKDIVEIGPVSQSFQGQDVIRKSAISSIYENPLAADHATIIDFGEHLTGFFKFSLRTINLTADAPIRLKFTFGEVPAEVVTPFDPYPGGLSRAWLQDEVVTVMTVGDTITIPRRLAFRYVKIEITGNPSYPVAFQSIDCEASTSASKVLNPLPADSDPLIQKIDQVAMNTLKECMQTVFEDGPKRDQRLWIGDLYLQSLANNYSFEQQDLTRRCLYLLAALSGDNGYLHATLYERPVPAPQKGQFLLEYALLFNATLKAYLEATGDQETVQDLWPVVKRQVDIVHDLLLADGRIDFQKASSTWWVFFDWKEGLHKEAALQGFMAFALKETLDLAKAIGKEKEFPALTEMIQRIKQAARKQLFDQQKRVFIGKLDPQVSYASQIWMVLGEVVQGKEAKNLFQALHKIPDAVKPNSPYLNHYYVEALIKAGLNTEAKAEMVNYWGSMVEKGADTFWEVYNQEDDYLSPYHFYPINSYCHAWSCTPIYFIRKYPTIFLK